MPTHKLLKRHFKLGVVRARLKEPRIHAGIVANNDVFVFFRGVVPEPDDILAVAVFTFLRIATNKPDQFNICLGE